MIESRRNGLEDSVWLDPFYQIVKTLPISFREFLQGSNKKPAKKLSRVLHGFSSQKLYATG